MWPGCWSVFTHLPYCIRGRWLCAGPAAAAGAGSVRGGGGGGTRGGRGLMENRRGLRTRGRGLKLGGRVQPLLSFRACAGGRKWWVGGETGRLWRWRRSSTPWRSTWRSSWRTSGSSALSSATSSPAARLGSTRNCEGAPLISLFVSRPGRGALPAALFPPSPPQTWCQNDPFSPYRNFMVTGLQDIDKCRQQLHDISVPLEVFE